ncbi:hypothetical protein CBR_g3675 [Chara braunii]|uniref:Protein phosphatase n=1 Tax=Chara braunii TaxID=69332 RepID=A0A388KG26_CHABU|nr:hypothetical protein CBR_g3675 [Chara braunii]|eukprot:GBG68976.1 hypothetical protein CBR_g3675 [Chara braunii]
MRRVLSCFLSSVFVLPLVIAFLAPCFLFPAFWACHLVTLLLLSFSYSALRVFIEFLLEIFRADKPIAIMELLGCYFTTASEREGGRLRYKLSLSNRYNICNDSNLHSSFDNDKCTKPLRVDPRVDTHLSKVGEPFDEQGDAVDIISLENDEEEDECSKQQQQQHHHHHHLQQQQQKKTEVEEASAQSGDARQETSAVCEGKDCDRSNAAACPVVAEDGNGDDVAMTEKQTTEEVSSALRCVEQVDEAVTDTCTDGPQTPDAASTDSSESDKAAPLTSDEPSVASDESSSVNGCAADSQSDGSSIAEIEVVSEESSPDTGSLMIGDDDGEAIFRESKGLRLKSGASMIPHPSKVKRGGEDAYFISDDGRWLGVADGVGGWAQMGIDAGLYSRELMTNSLQAVRASTSIEPSEVLIHAHRRTHAVGSSTALLASLDGNILKFANIGDCGFLVISNGRVVKASIHMQHAFNFPYQIGTRGDDPAEAERYEIDVKEGDILVMGSDGLFDNLFHEEIGQIASESKKAGESPQAAADHISRLAQQRASRTDGVSPFAVAAMFAGFRFEGGKMDDITVLVSYLEK